MFPQNTLVVGTNFWNHDASIFAIDVEGRRGFGMSTERVTRYKHDTLPPISPLRELIREWEIDAGRVRRVVVATNLESQMSWPVQLDLYDETALFRAALGKRFKRDVIAAHAAHAAAPRWRRLLRMSATAAGRRWLRHRLGGARPTVLFPEMARHEFSRLFPAAEIELMPFDHHLAHAAAGLALSSFEDPLIVSIDGFGDGYFSKAFVRHGSDLKVVSASPAIDARPLDPRGRVGAFVPAEALETAVFDDMTLGHFYSIFTWLLGFEPVCDEGKVEALAAYSDPAPELLEALRATVTLDPEAPRLLVSQDHALALFYDIPRLRAFVDRDGREAVASAMQRLLEERALDLVRALLAKHPKRQLILTGGCAANVIMNMRIFEEACSELFVVPAMADDGTALGAAALAVRRLGAPDEAFDFLRSTPVPYFGNRYPRSQALAALRRARSRISYEDRSGDWPEGVAGFLHAGEIGAVYQGHMEWGPRALGNRSILANARSANSRDRLNQVVKRRPLFQPFCPTILSEERDRLFERSYLNRHMTCAFRMRREFWNELPSAVHVDGTARAQFLSAGDNPDFHRVLTELKRLGGFGVVINTSFNLHGRTIVNTPADAIEDFLDSRMEFLALDGYLVRRR